jgi:DNA-binding response OmpR family regulator
MGADARLSGAFYYVVQDHLRVLFVDDDPILREFASVHLATETCDVITAGDGVEGLLSIDEQNPDIVLLDLEMPRMDGFEVLKRLRAEEATARLPVIVVTGREDVAAIDRAFEVGATSFVSKPINWRLLSYQLRYVHRTYSAELALVKERAKAREGELAAARALSSVALEGSRFMAQALAADPALRPRAAAFAAALEAASSRDGSGEESAAA